MKARLKTFTQKINEAKSSFKDYKKSRTKMNATKFADSIGMDRNHIEAVKEVYVYLGVYYIEIRKDGKFDVVTSDTETFDNINDAEKYFWEDFVQYEV